MTKARSRSSKSSSLRIRTEATMGQLNGKSIMSQAAVGDLDVAWSRRSPQRARSVLSNWSRRSDFKLHLATWQSVGTESAISTSTKGGAHAHRGDQGFDTHSNS